MQEVRSALSEAREEIRKKDERIVQLEGAQQMTCNNNIEIFGVQRFMSSNQDMHFYTGLPNYDVFISIYRFVEPLIPQLNYRPDSNITPDHIPQRA